MPANLIDIPGGQFTMGSDRYYSEERPTCEVAVAAFRIARAAVTNSEFARFVAETGHVTTAELPLDPVAHPSLPATFYRPGSLVFRPTNGSVLLNDPRRWWDLVEGACWMAPEGPGSDLSARMDHPVVHVSSRDAAAYVEWAGLRLPSEMEWEWAAGGGARTTFPWGDALDPGDGVPANIWIGPFPWRNDRHPGPHYSTSVGRFAPNGFGLDDMIGNVWEWTSTPFDRPSEVMACCAPPSCGGEQVLSVKGGSFLCAESYCQRYRPAARSPQEESATAGNIGFRCAADA